MRRIVRKMMKRKKIIDHIIRRISLRREWLWEPQSLEVMVVVFFLRRWVVVGRKWRSCYFILFCFNDVL